MSKDIVKDEYTVLWGNSLDRLKELPDNSVDSIVTDPPYGLSDKQDVSTILTEWVSGNDAYIPKGKGFMGKEWDAFVPPPAIWKECLRVLKPGGHLLAFFGSRTQDIGMLSIRLAGFEIRDTIMWVYGSGFPKSHNVSKAIDKDQGTLKFTGNKLKGVGNTNTSALAKLYSEYDETTPGSPEAKQWEGWGTALKPANEPIVLARKPLEGTVASNVMKWGTGGLNIHQSRIGSTGAKTSANVTTNTYQGNSYNKSVTKVEKTVVHNYGRFPSNFIVSHNDDCEATGETIVSKTSAGSRTSNFGEEEKISGGNNSPEYKPTTAITEVYTCSPGCQVEELNKQQDGVAKFFYTPKASKKDRNEGLEHLQAKSNRVNAPRVNEEEKHSNKMNNFHPTVKPTPLMEYLIKLVTPKGGTVLDPFTGSGSTGKAALRNGFKFIGVELTEEYLPIIEGRLDYEIEQKQIKQPTLWEETNE